MGGDSTPSGICFLDILVSSKGEWGGAPKLTLRPPPPPKGKLPHREHSCSKTKKNILLFKEEQRVAGHGQFKIKYNSRHSHLQLKVNTLF